MKLYHFNPNDYGDEYFVMAENKAMAHKSLLNHLENMIKSKPDLIYSYFKNDLEEWRKANPLDANSYPYKYTIDEHEVGVVIRTETC